MVQRRDFLFRLLLLGAAALAAVAAGCVHLPPPVKAEMERSEPGADNNFARGSIAMQSQVNASK